jgi:hypothetical protein
MDRITMFIETNRLFGARRTTRDGDRQVSAFVQLLIGRLTKMPAIFDGAAVPTLLRG